MNANAQLWHPAVPGKVISSNEVHVWRSFLDMKAYQREDLLKTLSTDETARAERFHFERERNRFIVAHGVLRQLLGSYLGKSPHELRFEYTSHGKPVLDTQFGEDDFNFNMSHSDAFALYAITQGQNVGIDIERLYDNVEVEQIAKRFFSTKEISSLKEIHKNKRNELFFLYWTRKEAFVKVTGEGISFPLEMCDVSSISGRVLSPIKIVGDKRESSRWYGQDLFPGHGYAAAIAVERSDSNIFCRHYSV